MCTVSTEPVHLKLALPDGSTLSLDDERYKGKALVLAVMGTWCPNCMDETAFLSAYYNQNKQRGFEVIALAYEYTTNLERSTKSLQKFAISL
jgi:peroxiredoxin